MFPNLQLLLIEDDHDIANQLHEIAQKINPGIGLVWEQCLEKGLEQVKGESFFDAVILDLKLPKTEGGLDIDDVNGMRILTEVLSRRPGTIIFVLSASNNPEVFATLMRNANKCYPWSEAQERPAIDHIPKKNFPEVEEWIFQADVAVRSLKASVELNFVSPNHSSLSDRHDRLLRSFLKGRGIEVVNVSILSGGLSGSKVLRIHDPEKNLELVAKFDSDKKIRLDSTNYDKYVNELPAPATPRKLGMNEYGGADQSGVFYGIENGFSQSYFSCAFSENYCSVAAVENCKSHLQVWWNAGSKVRCTIKETRRLFLRDGDWENLVFKFSLDWLEEFEGEEFNSRFSTIHADLHGENVLVDPSDGSAILIDYGDIKNGPAGYDPLTLECSLIFHPSAAVLDNWPTNTNLENWSNVNAFIDGAPENIAESIKHCRLWLEEVSFGPRDQAVALYSYAVRQLKYPGTNKSYAITLLEVARELYHSS